MRVDDLCFADAFNVLMAAGRPLKLEFENPFAVSHAIAAANSGRGGAGRRATKDQPTGWRCESCTMINSPGGRPSCSVCGTARSPSATWNCPKCTMMNAAAVGTCEACGFKAGAGAGAPSEAAAPSGVLMCGNIACGGQFTAPPGVPQVNCPFCN